MATQVNGLKRLRTGKPKFKTPPTPGSATQKRKAHRAQMEREKKAGGAK